MTESSAVKSLPFAELDATLLRLLAEYRLQGGHGSAAHTLFRDFLPTLTKRLAYEFPTASSEDILYFTWEHTRKPGVEMASSPCAYLMHCVRDSLRRKMRADRHQVSENMIKSKFWKTMTEQIGLQDGERFVLPVGDDEGAVLNSLSTPSTRPSSYVWQDLVGLLTDLRWPLPLAAEAVEVLECSMDSLRFDPVKTISELPPMVPAPNREALIVFVTSPRGYVWGRLRGMSKNGASRLPTVRNQIPSLVFIGSPTFK